MRRRAHRLPLQLLPPPACLLGEHIFIQYLVTSTTAGWPGRAAEHATTLTARYYSLSAEQCRRPPTSRTFLRAATVVATERAARRRVTFWWFPSISPARRAGLQSRYDCAGSQALALAGWDKGAHALTCRCCKTFCVH